MSDGCFKELDGGSRARQDIEGRPIRFSRSSPKTIGGSVQQRVRGTWTRSRLGVILLVAFVYGTWFNLLDSVIYCINASTCKSIGEIFGGNQLYQPWNVFGHMIPSMLMFFFRPLKSELFVAGFLISTAVMDSPLWGVARLLRGSPLWHGDQTGNHVPTSDLSEWVTYYYNPFGTYLVWDSYWLLPGFPTSAAIFWSLVLRVVLAALLIWWQNRQEMLGREFSITRLLVRRSSGASLVN
ncbi:MAG: hypothetical protein HYY67_08880 [Thaumarchaeota archaeon]|nr:hypothetical protein [Nitrososphaerota archaeon]